MASEPNMGQVRPGDNQPAHPEGPPLTLGVKTFRYRSSYFLLSFSPQLIPSSIHSILWVYLYISIVIPKKI